MTDDRPQSDKEWKARLAPEQYRVLRRGGTETPFTGLYNDCHDPGVYRCAACHAALFDADDKFDSGTGWPSFVAPAQDHSVSLQRQGLILRRTEVRCATCDSHLGHVFADGPRDRGGQRYCINSAALDLDPAVRVSGSPGSRTEQLVMARSILICDDTEQVRRLMVAILRPQGYDLREAVDGEAALDAAAAHRPDLVILDLHMPGLDGLAVLARLREDPRLADVRVMLLSGGAEALDASWAEQVGADGQLAKPFRAEDLTGAVRSLLDG